MRLEKDRPLVVLRLVCFPMIMRITNKYNLPAGLVAAVTFSERNREGCDYTITELLTPPRILALSRLHEDKLEEDASDRIWALMGQAGHSVLQRYGKHVKGATVEERAIIEVQYGSRKFKIGGQLDYLTTDQNELDDFKFTSVWAIKDGLKPEWEQQLNLYRWLAWHYGVTIDTMKIIAIGRDWSVREARFDKSYPQEQVQVFTVAPWSWGYCEQFCRDRIALHEAAKITLPECSSAETWEKPEKWAVMKRGNKRATKVCRTQYEASDYIERDTRGGSYTIEHRPAERPRCESYCPCATVCVQYLQWSGRIDPHNDHPTGDIIPGIS